MMLNLGQELNFSVNCSYFHNYSRISYQYLSLSRVFIILFHSTWYPALVGLVPRVSSDVLLEVGQLGELPLTDLAPVRLDAEVDTGVLGEVGAVGEGLVAGRALVRLRLAHVDLRVQLEVRFRCKYLKKALLSTSIFLSSA